LLRGRLDQRPAQSLRCLNVTVRQRVASRPD
jgi:hypothetical protein